LLKGGRNALLLWKPCGGRKRGVGDGFGEEEKKGRKISKGKKAIQPGFATHQWR